MFRNTIVKLLARYDIQPTILRFATGQEKQYLIETYPAERDDEYARAKLSTMMAQMDVAPVVHTPEESLYKLFTTTFDILVQREDWDSLKRLLGKMYDPDYYRFAELTLNRLSKHERIRQIPRDAFRIAFQIPQNRMDEFTDACFSIEELARLMNALVKNERWDVVEDFLTTAKETYKSGARTSLARVVLRRGEDSMPRTTYQLALDTDPIVQVRSIANYDFFWAG